MCKLDLNKINQSRLHLQMKIIMVFIKYLLNVIILGQVFKLMDEGCFYDNNKLYAFGSLRANSALFNFLGRERQKDICKSYEGTL